MNGPCIICPTLEDMDEPPFGEQKTKPFLQAVLSQGAIGFDPPGTRNGHPWPQDWTQGLNLLLTLQGQANIWEDLKTKKDAEIIEHFEALVSTTEANASDIFVRDMATELWSACRAYQEEKYTVAEQYEEAHLLFKETRWRQAALYYSKTIFALFVSAPISEELRHFNERDSSTGELALLPHHVLYLDLRLKQIESLFRDDQFQRAALYGRQALDFMCRYKSRDTVGYYGLHFPDRYSALQLYVGDSEMAMLNLRGAILSCSHAIDAYSEIANAPSIEPDIGSFRQSYFEKMASYFEDGGGLDDHVERDRRAAKIIVDPNRDRGVTERNQFVVNELDSALRIAKDGDVIFLENGTYSPRRDDTDDSGKKKATFEVTKAVRLVGSSTSKAVISGSLVKWGGGSVRVERLKLEIGLDIDSDDDAYFMAGETVFENCVIETPVNTAMFIINAAARNNEHSAQQPTKLVFQFCILDGLENARRLVCFQGPECVVETNLCSITGFYSFCTVIKNNESQPSHGHFGIRNSVLYELQDGIRIVGHEDSTLAVNVEGCHFDMCRYMAEFPSHAVYVEGGGSVRVRNCRIAFDNIDSVGLALHSVANASLDGIHLETTSEGSRALALAEAVKISNVMRLSMQRLDIMGFRIGIHFNSPEEKAGKVDLDNCSFRSCATGVLVETSQQGSCSSGCNTCREPAPNPNRVLFLSRLQFDTCHYGVFNADSGARLEVGGCEFDSVARPVLISQECLPASHVQDNVYKLNEAVEHDASEEDYGALAGKLYLLFATQENLPHRIALDKVENLTFIHCAEEEKLLLEKFRAHRSSSLEDE